jgi:hypothetical protein
MRPLKLSQMPFCIGLPSSMKCHATWFSAIQASTAFEVSSVPLSETIIAGLPRRATRAESSRATRWPEIEVSAIAARHSLVTSSTMLRIRKRRPQTIWSWTKSSDQREFGSAGRGSSGTRVPVARLRPRRRRTISPSSR